MAIVKLALLDFSSTFLSILEATNLFACPMSSYKLTETNAWAHYTPGTYTDFYYFLSTNIL